MTNLYYFAPVCVRIVMDEHNERLQPVGIDNHANI